jgi:lipid A 4'-phosphatase
LLLALVQPGKVARYWWRHALAWVLVVAFGVGLLVHNALKDQVGRPRPVHVQAFGGPAPYIPALQLSSHCDTNCSFVSGHAAGAFSIMAWGMLACRRRKLQWLWAGLVFGTVVGAVRMAQGGHFLSDVLFAALAVWWTHHLIGRLWIRSKAVLLHYRRKQLPGGAGPLA